MGGSNTETHVHIIFSRSVSFLIFVAFFFDAAKLLLYGVIYPAESFARCLCYRVMFCMSLSRIC